MKYLVIGEDKEGAMQMAEKLAESLGLPLHKEVKLVSKNISNLADDAIYFGAGIKYQTAKSWFFDAIIIYRPAQLYNEALASKKPLKLFKVVVAETGEIAVFNSTPCNALRQAMACNYRKQLNKQFGEGYAYVTLDKDSIQTINNIKNS